MYSLSLYIEKQHIRTQPKKTTSFHCDTDVTLVWIWTHSSF